ncbi:APC family permease [Streptomyces luteolus]|uniref:Amino acid permease n=1 Tax=Streptomyces luteolus TaxID=3043615 RepID=A0ABT6SWK7_9ACTN|nr:amino acid permease [Streptomyces sp. B-S-A12]MDI3419806.1 amino acid permease [Streptomyces sp. B-S-A12]
MVHQSGLQAGTGAALCVGAVLGPGALTLTSTAAAAAGPGSVLAWLALVMVSLPVALVFAALGARHPDGGGVSAFVRTAFTRRTFGPWLGRTVGWWFYWAVPLGVSAAALIGGAYTATAMGWGTHAAPVVALLILVAAHGANLTGIRLSGRLQLLMVGLLSVLLAATVAVTGPQVQLAHFSPFLPHGWSAVGTAASILFFAFAGWEAVSHLSAEFSAPARDLPRATLLAWGIVTVLYLGLALVTIGVLGTRAGTTTAPLTLLLEQGIGATARPVAAAAALLLTFGAVNAYLAGAARLGGTLARERALPRVFAERVAAESGAPRRSLTTVTLAAAATTGAAAGGLVDLETLLQATSACLASVTLAGLASATVLLRDQPALRTAAAASCCMVAAVLVFCGAYLLLPAALAAAAFLFRPAGATRGTSPAVSHRASVPDHQQDDVAV